MTPPQDAVTAPPPLAEARPATPRVAQTHDGYVDFFGYATAAGGWLFCGWSSRRWDEAVVVEDEGLGFEVLADIRHGNAPALKDQALKQPMSAAHVPFEVSAGISKTRQVVVACASRRPLVSVQAFHPSRLAEDGEHLRMTTAFAGTYARFFARIRSANRLNR